MQVRHLPGIAAGAELQADVCIVGTGPAGATIALELARSDLKVIVVESGDLERSVAADQLDEIENVGRPRILDQWLVRNRIFGGSSYTWAGRCIPFEEIDYQKREWVPYSGWPITSADLAPFVARSLAYLGLSAAARPAPYQHGFGKLGSENQDAQLDTELLSPVVWQFSKDASRRSLSFNPPTSGVNFGQQLTRENARNIDLFLDASVTNINTNEDGTAVNSIDVCASDGKRRAVSAPIIVLCAGGIENARLLLASKDVHRHGLGNEKDLVGRFLMDHLKGDIVSFDPAEAEPLRRLFGRFQVKSIDGEHWFDRGMQLVPPLQRKLGLLNGALFLDEHDHIASDDPWLAMKRIAQRKGPFIQDALSVGLGSGLIANGLAQYLISKRSLPRKMKELAIRCIVEQQPNPASRITLSDRLDRLGVPLPKINWQVAEQDQTTIKALANLFANEAKRFGLKPKLRPWILEDRDLPPEYRDIAHPIGTTRMASDRSAGVVDANCEVFGVNGLYVAGSSIFPTGGHANPTQMIVAFAIRLADTIKKRSLNRDIPAVLKVTAS
jgi:choline dehydrogenase-like flavoprotein